MKKLIAVTDLVRNAASIAREVEAERTAYRITRGGHGSVVLVDEEYFNGWMAALDEMRRPDWREVHDQTSRDIAAGRGRNLDTIAKELGPAMRTCESAGTGRDRCHDWRRWLRSR